MFKPIFVVGCVLFYLLYLTDVMVIVPVADLITTLADVIAIMCVGWYYHTCWILLFYKANVFLPLCDRCCVTVLPVYLADVIAMVADVIATQLQIVLADVIAMVEEV